jgi:hypothetical protein
MILEDGDDQLDGLHRHVELLVQSHGHNPILELGGEQLKLVLKIRIKYVTIMMLPYCTVYKSVGIENGRGVS